MNLSALKGAARAERRAYERAALQAQWIGGFAQTHPDHYPTVEKMMGTKKDTPAMNGRQITSAMNAWARRLS